MIKEACQLEQGFKGGGVQIVMIQKKLLNPPKHAYFYGVNKYNFLIVPKTFLAGYLCPRL